jgi:hypothetical protein
MSVGDLRLNPLPYQEAIRDFLKAEEARVWQWFAEHQTGDEHAEAVRFDLLKTTYRVERSADPQLYVTADDVAHALSLDAPITIYQSQNPERLNAGLAYVPREAHVIFEGPIKSKLRDIEVRALLAHELAHFSLWQRWDGEFLIVDQILAALSHDEDADAAHAASARLFYLYNEIFCDRGALAVVGDPLVVVSMLVKLATGLEEVDAASYIRQAEEIFHKGPAKTAGLTHPEAFIRARAIALWDKGDQAVEEKIAEMIEGTPALNELDLVAQRRVQGHTRRLIDEFLNATWMRTDPVLAHARLYFPEYSWPMDSAGANELTQVLKTDDQPLKDYYCYVLLDFVTADRELEEMPLAAAMQLSERLGLKDRFVDIVKRELRLTKKQIEKIDQSKDALLGKVAEKARDE